MQQTCSMPSQTESAIERKRQQNRNSQRTYKKSILKRLEELEMQREASSENCSPKADTRHTMRSPQSPSSSCEHQGGAAGPDLVPFSDLVNWTEGHTVEHLGNFNGVLMSRSPTSTNIPDRNHQREFSHLYSSVEFQSQEILAPGSLQLYRKDSGSSSSSASQNQRKSTALHHAVKKGTEGIVRLLVQHGANIHAVDSLGQTPLHVAVENDHKGIICYLLEVGSNLNMPDYQGRMPLETAIASDNEQLVQLLLSKGADANFPCDDFVERECSI